LRYFAIVNILIKVKILGVLTLVILSSTIDSDKNRPRNRTDESENAYKSIEDYSSTRR